MANPTVMKNSKVLWFLFSALVVAAVITGCKKEEPEPPEDTSTTSATDNAFADAIFADVWSIADEAARGADGIKSTTGALTCATVTVDTSANPKSITINFDSLGCVSQDGRMRKGIIFATFSGRYRDPGTFISVTLINYYVDQYKVEGTHTVTNEGTNTAGNLWYSVEIDSVLILDTTNQHQITWESSRQREWIAGESTIWNPFDDVYLITGTANGINQLGGTFDVEITTPLRVQIGCPWVTEGILEVRPQGLYTRYVDYGTGVCDNDAVVTINGVDYPIQM